MLPMVSPKKLGVEIVGMHLIEVSVEVVKALSERMTFLANFSKPPLADQSGGIVRFLQFLGNRQVLVPQALAGHIPSRISANVRVSHMLSGHEHASGRSAYGGSRIKAGESHTLRRHFVQTGRLD